MKINKLLIALLAGAALVVSCAQDEIDGALDRISSIENRVTALEAKVEALNSQVLAAQDAVDALQAKKFITNVQQVDGGVTITLEGGKVFFVSNGKDGAQGEPGAAGKDGNDGKDATDPIVSIIDVEGTLVWAVNGEALLYDGNVVPVYQGEATVTPYFKIEGEKLYVKYGADGEWELIGEVGKNTVDAVFSDVKIGEETVIFTLADGTTTFEVPMVKAFKLVIADEIGVDAGAEVKIPYEVKFKTEATTVDVFTNNGYEATVEAENIVVSVPDPAVKAQMLAWAESGTGLTSIKKVAFEGPYAKVEDVDEITADGGEIEVPVVSNVEIDVLDEDEDWLSYKETKATAYTIVLVAEANTTFVPRSASVKVVRKSDKALLQTITVAQKPTMPVALNGEKKYAKIQDALTAAEALTEGTANITLAYATFEEAVKIDGTKIAVPVVIDGGESKAKLVGGIEIYQNAATIKNLDITVAATSLSSLGGTYLNDAGAGYAFGIQINEPGHGVTIQDNVISNSVTNATAIYVAANATKDVEGDLITGNVLNCGTQRGMQVYGSIKLIDNTITSSKYPVRLGMGYGMKTVISGNSFVTDKETATAIDVLANLADADITLGDGETDDNLYNAYFTNRANRTGAESVTWHPAIANPYPNSATNVSMNGFYFNTLQAAVNAAAKLTSGTAEITVKEGATIVEEVKISDISVPVVIDGQVPATTVVGSFEIKGVKATIRNFTINPTENSKTTLSEDGWYTNAYTTGVEIDGSGFGCLLENLTINVAQADGTGIWVGYAKGEERDVIKNVTINGSEASGRKIQAYDSILEVANCTFNGSYSYAVRVGGTGGSDVVLKGNRFNNAKDNAAVAVQFNSLAASNIVLGDGTKNDNTEDGSFGSLFAAGNAWLFHNNNFFYPDLMYVQSDPDVATPTEFQLKVCDKLGRVWAKWDQYDRDWDDEILPQTTGNNWGRHGAVSGQYLYIPIAQASLANSGIAVFDVLTGKFLAKVTDGIQDKGHFKVCGTAKLGETIYVCSMGMASNGTPLVVYKLVSPSPYFTKLEKVMEFTVPTGGRLGDTMTSWGTDEQGILAFVDYFQPGEHRASYMFQVKNGEITNAEEPYCPAYMNTTSGKSYMLGLYFFSGDTTVEGGHYAILSGNNAEVVRGVSTWNKDGWYNQQITTGVYAEYSTNGIFDHNVLDPTLMTIDGKQHLVYTTVKDAKGSLRLVDISGEGGVLTRIQNLGSAEGVAAKTLAYPLGTPGRVNGTGPNVIGTNGTGFVSTTIIDGVTYIVAGVTEVGISCFKLN